MKFEDTLAMRVRYLSNQFSRFLGEIKSQFEREVPEAERVTGLQGWVIVYLYENAERGVYQKDIEKQFNVRRSTVTVLLQLMEKNGLVVRTVDPRDQRQKRLELTEKAKDLYRLVGQSIARAEAWATRGVGEAELAAFYQTMNKIAKNIS